jgi:hypothetical protein
MNAAYINVANKNWQQATNCVTLVMKIYEKNQQKLKLGDKFMCLRQILGDIDKSSDGSAYKEVSAADMKLDMQDVQHTHSEMDSKFSQIRKFFKNEFHKSSHMESKLKFLNGNIQSLKKLGFDLVDIQHMLIEQYKMQIFRKNETHVNIKQM